MEKKFDLVKKNFRSSAKTNFGSSEIRSTDPSPILQVIPLRARNVSFGN